MEEKKEYAILTEKGYINADLMTESEAIRFWFLVTKEIKANNNNNVQDGHLLTIYMDNCKLCFIQVVKFI